MFDGDLAKWVRLQLPYFLNVGAGVTVVGTVTARCTITVPTNESEARGVTATNPSPKLKRIGSRSLTVLGAGCGVLCTAVVCNIVCCLQLSTVYFLSAFVYFLLYSVSFLSQAGGGAAARCPVSQSAAGAAAQCNSFATAAGAGSKQVGRQQRVLPVTQPSLSLHMNLGESLLKHGKQSPQSSKVLFSLLVIQHVIT